MLLLRSDRPHQASSLLQPHLVSWESSTRDPPEEFPVPDEPEMRPLPPETEPTPAPEIVPDEGPEIEPDSPPESPPADRLDLSS